jgi:ubiquinone/menaquinone biosynthesis C-methylase UbiE
MKKPSQPDSPDNLFNNKVLIKSPIPDVLDKFGKIYIQTREKEGRFYTDSQVVKLPFIEKTHRYYSEWQLRARSAKLLKKHIELDNLPKNILEIGCGNGWLSNLLANISGTEVWGIDVNEPELEQAERVFGKKENLHFCRCNIFDRPFEKGSFNFIVLASVIQYFPDIKLLIRELLTLLKLNGEIHIIDSPFYEAAEVEKAALRSKQYYRKIEAPEMAENYFHHNLNTLLKSFDVKIHFPVHSLKEKILSKFLNKSVSSFPWIIIKKE